MVASDALFHTHSHRLAELGLRGHLVSMFAQREYVANGGLMAYGENLYDFFKRSAYVDRIFKGADPGELPIQQPTRFYLTINLETASAVGLTLSSTLLLRADEVIE